MENVLNHPTFTAMSLSMKRIYTDVQVYVIQKVVKVLLYEKHKTDLKARQM